jgi:hypothetical protein
MPGWSNEGKADWDKGQTDSEIAVNRSSNSADMAHENDNFNSYENKGSSQRSRTGCCNILGAIVSILFVGLFIAGAIYYKNDKSWMDRQWIIYYSFQAAVAAISILTRVGCNGQYESIANSFATSGLIWSIVLIIITSIAYRKSEGDSLSFDELRADVYEMENNQDAFELSSALTGFVNCLYHMILYCCCS